MTRRDQLLELARDLPDGSAMTVPASWVLEALDGASPAVSDDSPMDYTVAALAERLGRSPSTIRGWIDRGELDAYKLKAREWRVPRAALEVFLERQRAGTTPAARSFLRSKGSLGDWRDEKRPRAGASVAR